MATFNSPAVLLNKPVSVSEEKVSDGLPALPAGIVKILPTLSKTSKVKDDDLTNLLQYYDLIEELKTTNVPVQA